MVVKKKRKYKYLVFRLPVTMEDSGREFFHGRFNTRKAATEFIENEAAESEGYYSKNDYKIIREPLGR